MIIDLGQFIRMLRDAATRYLNMMEQMAGPERWAELSAVTLSSGQTLPTLRAAIETGSELGTYIIAEFLGAEVAMGLFKAAADAETEISIAKLKQKLSGKDPS